jgi:FkbH-like protein
VRFEDWIRDIKADEKEKCRMLEKNYEDLLEALKGKRADNVYLIGIFPSEDSSVKTRNALGSEVLECIHKLKLRMEEELKQIKNIFTVDLRDINKLYSIKEVYDPYRDKVGHIPFTDEFYAAMGTTIARKICALRKTPFKVIVLDCDNTLWKGVCGEDGTLGVKVTKDFEEFQKMLLQKHDEGMLLALCSKNNEKDVWEVFEKNNGMLLKREHLAAWRINWNSKSENIKELAEELNLGVDSFIFMDDSPVECSEVMMNVPEVLTLQIPKDSKAIPMYIRHVWAFDRAIITKEDRVRTQMYTAERERKSLLNKNTSIEDFLRSLQLKMSMNFIQEENMARAYQMTQRTNQFNLSTIRRTEEELRTLVNNENIVSWVIEVKDRFGDYGLVGLIIGEKRNTSLFIDTFLLSCRALGRGVEDAVLVGLVDYCKNEKLKTIAADYYPTAKNKPFLEFLEKGLWNKVNQTETYVEFEIEINKFDRQVDFIDCYYNSSYKQEKDGYKGFKEESACSRDNSQAGAAVALAEGEEPYWEVNIPGGETLKHIEYLLALDNYTGKRLLQLPINEENSPELISVQEYGLLEMKLKKD